MRKLYCKRRESNKIFKKGNPLPKKEGDFFMAKKKKICLEELTEEEKMKYEIAKELGLLERVLEDGWRSLSSKETGKIGGLVTKRRREMKVAK